MKAVRKDGLFVQRFSSMKTILLAAGRSRRVKPIEDKNFLRFCGKFLIHHQIDALVQAGFNDLILVGGAHNLERLNQFSADLKSEAKSNQKDLAIAVVEQTDLGAGMAGAVLAAAAYIKEHVKSEESVFVVSTNDVVDPEAYQLLFDAAQNPEVDSIILGKTVEDYFPGGYLQIDKKNRIERIIEKPGAGNEPSRLVNLVLHVHKKGHALFDALESAQSDRDDRYEVALDALIKAGHRMMAVPYSGYWQAIKFPWHVFPVARYFFEKSPPRIAGIVEEGAKIVGEVIVEGGAKIMAGATVVGPAYIGKNSVVATNALVRDAYLGERCVVGFSTEVARSVLGDDVWTHSNYIGDSVIGDNVSFGAGTVTGNLRFDEKAIDVTIGKGKVSSGMNKLGLFTGNNIRVGINTSFMPGIKLGSNSLIGPGIVVNQNIEEGSYVRGEVTLKISANKMLGDFPIRARYNT